MTRTRSGRLWKERRSRFHVRPLEDVSIDYGSGGLLQAIINKGIEAYGGMDQLFFNSVWPLVQKAISPSLGKAFEMVPSESGGIQYVVDLRGSCFPEAIDGRCPSRNFAMNTTAKMRVFGDPKVVLTEYANTLEAAGEKPSTILANAVKAYKEGKDVFPDSKVTSQVNVVLGADDEMTVDIEEKASIPIGMLTSLAGPSIGTLMDFVPHKSALKAGGSFEMRDGVVSVFGLEYQNVKLPVVVTEGGTDALVIGGVVKAFSAKKINSTSQVSPDAPDMLGASSPITIRSTAMRMQLSESGVEASIVDGPGPEVSIAKDYIHSMLEAPTAAWGVPTNVRNGSSMLADGPLPYRFRRPFSSMPSKPDFSKLLEGFEAETDVTLEGEHPFENIRQVSFDVKVTTRSMLHMDQSFWKGILSTPSSDFGYVHYSVAGYFGQSDKMGQAKPALALLHCATLEIFKVKKRDDMYGSTYLEVDLSTAM
mmetsp:Transcript_56762/g.133261  ORF Transcript_56762/g.133261 Transcript_56762/m.133261 type:complete len:479 (-) Transcript_56762:411-1847(-)